MKMMIKVSSVFVLFIMVVSCATTQTPSALPEKYNFGNELEAVDQISTFMVPRWQYVDQQSVIFRINWKDYYLLVLRRPMYEKNPLAISLTKEIPRIAEVHEDYAWALSGSQPNPSAIKIISGHDRIIVDGGGVFYYYVIDKIYKFEGREQKEEIRIRLSAN